MTRWRRVLAIAAVVALSCMYLSTAALPASAGDAVVTVRIRDNVFEPASLRITPGTTVRWVNEGRNRHDVTPDRGREFGSAKLRPGQSYAHKFEDAGAFALVLEMVRNRYLNGEVVRLDGGARLQPK